MRTALLRFLRAARLIELADRAIALRAARKLRRANDAYRHAHPQRAFPDPMLVFEVAGHASLEAFDHSGAQHARTIANLLRGAGLAAAPSVLEWGCGPGRILGHMSAALNDKGATLHGCDPDARSIEFAQRAYPAIAFQRIAPTPPTAYETGTFDAIYGVSIFTHLDERGAKAWAGELARLCAPGGCVLVTSHGASAAGRLEGAEKCAFDAGLYVVLGGARVGRRTFASYFNEAAGRRLFAPFFAELAFRGGAAEDLGQDIWLLRHPRRA